MSCEYVEVCVKGVPDSYKRAELYVRPQTVYYPMYNVQHGCGHELCSVKCVYAVCTCMAIVCLF